MSDVCVADRGPAVWGPRGLRRPWSTWPRILPYSGLLAVLLARYAASWVLLGLFAHLPVALGDSVGRRRTLVTVITQDGRHLFM